MIFYACVGVKGMRELGQMKTKGATSHIDVPLSALKETTASVGSSE